MTSREEFETELEQVRQNGYAFDREEHTSGVCAIGACIRDPFGSHIAISVPIPATRFYGHETELAATLLKYRRMIETALGANPA
jgi:DNA-binding IclR family transcriptional regulator